MSLCVLLTKTTLCRKGENSALSTCRSLLYQTMCQKSRLRYIYYNNLHDSQVFPVHGASHSHEKLLVSSVHVAPLLHGADWQSSTVSTLQSSPLHLSSQIQMTPPPTLSTQSPLPLQLSASHSGISIKWSVIGNPSQDIAKYMWVVKHVVTQEHIQSNTHHSHNFIGSRIFTSCWMKKPFI